MPVDRGVLVKHISELVRDYFKIQEEKVVDTRDNCYELFDSYGFSLCFFQKMGK